MQDLPVHTAPEEFRHKVDVPAPANGKIVSLSNLESPLLSQGFFGPGFAIKTSSSQILSPFSGTVLTCDPLDYSVTFQATNGLKLRIKIGLNTQSLMGERCEFLVRPKDKIAQSSPLMRISPPWLKQKGIEPICVVTLINYKQITAVVANRHSQCSAIQDSVFSVYI